MIEFNEPDELVRHNSDGKRDNIRAALLVNLESVLFALFPAGKMRRGKFLIGDILGNPGDSLEVVLEGDKAGLWTDRADNSGGDIFALIGGHYSIDAHTDFPRVLQRSSALVGCSPAVKVSGTRRQGTAFNDLGPATARWDYQDAQGNLLAVVYRYDPPGQRKEFRPWDAKRRKMAPPNPRPLYNQPGLVISDKAVLVEGEKCAQALIDVGVVATTAMHGANAPTDKTDWSPLSGKSVLIWPDKDKPGWEYADRASQAILAAGAISCHILYPPKDQPEGWDAADALADGFDAVGFLAQGPRMQIHLPAGGSQGEGSELDTSPGDSEQTVWGTEDALALAFTRRYHQDWRYVSGWGKWLVWDGQRWRTEDTLASTDLIRHVCRHASLKASNPKAATKLAGSSTISGVERLARSDRRHAATTDEWDADIWLLNATGGVVDLRTGRIRPHDRHDRMTKIATATPRGPCSQWLSFLNDVTDGDKDLQGYLQRMVGYCLTGSTSAHALFFLYGTGANGKSVFVNTLTSILGDYSSTAPMDTFVETRGDRHPTDLAGLRGARFVTAIETEQGRRWNESKVKAITGGDKVSARFMRQDFFEYTPQFKPIIVGNHKPAIRNIDEAMKRRFHLIPFTVTIPPERRDGKLTGKLLAERDGILAWAIEGCLAWQRAGLHPPECVVSATNEYFEAEDALGQWIEERAQIHPEAKQATADLFADWREWAERAGEYTGSIKRFAELLITRGFMSTRLHGGIRAIKGLILQANHENRHYTDGLD